MTDNDFESRIARIMNDNVDQKLAGVDRRAPHFDPERVATGNRRHARLMLPLAAAAAVAAITVGAVALAGSSRHHSAPPAGTTSTTPAPTSPTSQSAPPTQQTTTAKQSTPTVLSHPVTLGGARIALPVGWGAHDIGLFGNSTYAHVWCLVPAGHSVPTDSVNCPITLTQIDPNDNPIDVDTEGGLSSNPHYCFAGTNVHTTEQAGDRPFGGRTSDWRHWSITCTGHDYEIEQYVVATTPGFILFSQNVDVTVRNAMTDIAQNSTLPAETSGLRLNDRGYLRNVTISGSTAHIQIDRAIPLAGGSVINNNLLTYAYDVPLAVYQAATVKVGDMVAVYTNGHTVRQFYKWQ